jgi:hypothetical protein
VDVDEAFEILHIIAPTYLEGEGEPADEAPYTVYPFSLLYPNQSDYDHQSKGTKPRAKMRASFLIVLLSPLPNALLQHPGLFAGKSLFTFHLSARGRLS